MTRIGKIGIALVLLFLAIQIVPVDQSNPPVVGAIDAPPEVQTLLDRSCNDCHSNETVWPWYSQIAPVSWLVTRDVKKGRDNLNFSEWTEYSDRRRNRKYEEIEELVTSGEMPLKIYLPLHPEGRLSDAERDVLIEWARQGQASAPAAEE